MGPISIKRQTETFCLDDGSDFLILEAFSSDQPSLFDHTPHSSSSDQDLSLNSDDSLDSSPSPTFKQLYHGDVMYDDVRSSSGGPRSGGGQSADESYLRRRQRNNAAVRRSREKARQRQRESQRRLAELAAENSRLQMKASVLMKELNLLRGLFPDDIQSTGNNQQLLMEVNNMLQADQ